MVYSVGGADDANGVNCVANDASCSLLSFRDVSSSSNSSGLSVLFTTQCRNDTIQIIHVYLF